MDFEPSEEQQQIRNQAGALARRFDDSYWRVCDREHRFPWEFYQALQRQAGSGSPSPRNMEEPSRHHRSLDPASKR